MSYGIEFTAYLSRCTEHEIDRQIEEHTEMLTFYERRLIALTSSNSTSLRNTFDGEPIDRWEYVAQEIPEILNEVVTIGRKLELLEQAKIADDRKEV